MTKKELQEQFEKEDVYKNPDPNDYCLPLNYYTAMSSFYKHYSEWLERKIIKTQEEKQQYFEIIEREGDF